MRVFDPSPLLLPGSLVLSWRKALLLRLLLLPLLVLLLPPTPPSSSFLVHRPISFSFLPPLFPSTTFSRHVLFVGVGRPLPPPILLGPIMTQHPPSPPPLPSLSLFWPCLNTVNKRPSLAGCYPRQGPQLSKSSVQQSFRLSDLMVVAPTTPVPADDGSKAVYQTSLEGLFVF
nr:unnamed protein product [Spirometra erinaceieuropaei]